MHENVAKRVMFVKRLSKAKVSPVLREVCLESHIWSSVCTTHLLAFSHIASDFYRGE